MEKSVGILLKLIRLAIDSEKDYSLPQDIDWQEVIELSYSHGVSALAVDGLQQLYNKCPGIAITLDSPQYEDLKYKWIGNQYSVELKNKVQSGIVSHLDGILGKEHVPFMIMKGISLSKYYPIPQHRECGDVDIYFGPQYKRSISLLRENGIKSVDSYYRHSTFTINGIKVENHRVLCDIRGPKQMEEFETLLEKEADAALESSDKVLFPTADFNALFLPWHVSAHFAFERVTLRHLLDWALFLAGDGAKVNKKKYLEAKTKYTFGYASFASILTYLSVKYLGIQERISPFWVDQCKYVDSELAEQVFSYMIIGSPKTRKKNVWSQRWVNIKQMWDNRWKYKKIYGVNMIAFLYYKTIGVIFKR